MKTELILKFRVIASHSLLGNETPHPHIWKIEAIVSGKPIDGKILDIVALRYAFQSLISPLSQTFLNENSIVGPEVMRFPTCETLSQYFREQFDAVLRKEFVRENPSVELQSIMVGICDMKGVEMGAVKLTSSN